MNCRCWIRSLLTLVLALPVVQATLMWVGSLLRAMGDAPASRVLGHLNTGVGVVWLLTLVGLVLALAAKALDDPPPTEG